MLMMLIKTLEEDVSTLRGPLVDLLDLAVCRDRIVGMTAYTSTRPVQAMQSDGAEGQIFRLFAAWPPARVATRTGHKMRMMSGPR